MSILSKVNLSSVLDKIAIPKIQQNRGQLFHQQRCPLDRSPHQRAYGEFEWLADTFGDWLPEWCQVRRSRCSASFRCRRFTGKLGEVLE